MPKERPILFSTEMVRAILEGRKTQTRRVIKHSHVYIDHPQKCTNEESRAIRNEPAQFAPGEVVAAINWLTKHCPYGQPGDILWVRETWAHRHETATAGGVEYTLVDEIIYKADNPDAIALWKPSIHMPREAARLFLRVKDVRVERLQDISEADAQAEGIQWIEKGPVRGGHYTDGKAILSFKTAREAFQSLWDNIPQRTDYTWHDNPWVWVIEFERVDMPGVG